MRALVALVLVAGLLALASAALADGVFVPKIDPRSHAEDISEPDQKALIAYGEGTEVMVLQVTYRGSASEFAWLVPTPSVPKVDRAYIATFHELHALTAPETRFWVDIRAIDFSKSARGTKVDAGRVWVIEKKNIDAYDIAVLKAKKAADLIAWLREHDYRVDPKLEPVVQGYLDRGWVFTGMRINTFERQRSARKLSEGALQSLSFRFKSPEPVFPLRISSLNPGRTRITLYTLVPYRTEAAGLETVCATRQYRGGGTIYFFRTLQALYGKEAVKNEHLDGLMITKLRGEFTSKEMTRDIVFARSRAQSLFAAAPVEATLFANIGASFIYGVILWLYCSFYVLLGLCVLSVFPIWRKVGQAWRSAAWTVVILSLPAAVVLIPSLGGLSVKSYEAVGVAAIVGCGALVVLAALWTAKRTRKARKY